MIDFCHLHSHTQFSLLDGASDIKALMKKAKSDGQSAVAITDHGNMFGVFRFVKEANAQGILPIIGCEFYLSSDRHIKTFEKSKGQKDERYHQLLLAKNIKGYQNLSKLCSLGYIEGLYGKYPRIDKELIEKYHEGLIATSCCLGAEIPQTILTGNLELAEQRLRWWLDIFGEDFYIEIQRHRGLENIDKTGTSQEDINQILIGFAKKYNIKVIATNDAHYVEEKDAEPHDILLCVNTGNLLEEKERFRFPSTDFFFKTKEEMNTLFGDVPNAIANTMEIAAKVEKISLTRDILLPIFPLPTGFDDQNVYLRHIANIGARKRYPIWTPEVEDRLNFELDVLIKSGYAGYFLIVQDFTSKARELGVSVGPGRGSAAGSIIAYVLGITNIDPIKYDLLFERFLNPERVSMPDIDIDFDDEGRGRVLDYVVEKYGKNQVAQIVTYGSMAAKSSLKDVGRVMNIPLNEVERVTKTFPNHLSATLKKVLKEDDIDKELKDVLQQDEKSKAYDFRKLAAEDSKLGHMIQTARKLEGSIRNTGIHACGVIITPDEITNYVPVSVAKDAEFLVSQFDNSVAEESGLLKMDFLGLRTLTIIKDALEIIKDRYGQIIDIDEISLEDDLTFELFQKGEMVAIFQYESAGMQKHLRDLRPTKFEDLIAMNALYRPGPIAYIPDFIARKNGKQTISYDLPDMAEFLEGTYGITVYQEQVMLLSQKLAGFSKGEADKLRKAMGKKQRSVLDEMFPKFAKGCAERGHAEDKVKKIWTDWEAFASYAFNKSHSTCYAYLAFQTAFLKAHYPAAFMAANLNNNMNDISKINVLLEEANRLRIPVLGPDVNESNIKFTVNQKDEIRFGLSALKGVGSGPVHELVEDRKKNGPFQDMYDIMTRLNLRSFNKKCMDAMALGGAFDSFSNIHRAQFVEPTGERGETFNEILLRYGGNYQSQKDSNQMSLFGDSITSYIDRPQPPVVPEWGQLEKLEREKEVTGLYISGHPLDDYHLEFKHFINCPLEYAEQTQGKLIKCGGIVTDAMHGTTQKGTGYARFTIADFTGSFQIQLYNESYENYKHLLTKGQVLYIEGINEKGYNSDRTFFKARDIRLLDTVGKAFTKSITIRIPVTKMNDHLIHELTAIVAEHTGPHTLKIKMILDDDLSGVDLVATTYKVNADYAFVRMIDDLELGYKIN
jgi:DNA polymerase III subunit alpha